MEELREKDALRAQEAKAPSPPPPKGKTYTSGLGGVRVSA